MTKYLYIILGTLTLILGLMGLVTPGLPTTPLILLTGYLYAKGSPKLYKKLEDNKLTGRYLKRLNNGLSWKARLFSIAFMWCMVSFTAFVVFENGRMRYIMLALGIIGTISQLLFLRKKKATIIDDNNREEVSENES